MRCKECYSDNPRITQVLGNQIRYLSEYEVQKYLNEREKMEIK